MAEIPKMWKWSIYKIVNPKNRVYIGITTDLSKRIKHYERADCRNQQALFHSLKKYGFPEHKFEVIETFTSDKDFAMGREIYWISFYKCNYSQLPKENGLNLTGGGRGSHGRVMTDETKEKLRQANLGKKYSDETKAKLSAMRKGKKIKSGWTDEKKAQLRLIKLKFRHTDESKKKISEAGMGKQYCLGKKLSPEHIEKIRKSHIGNTYNLGRKHSQEEKDYRASKLRGLKRSPDSIINLRRAASERGGKSLVQLDINGVVIRDFPSIGEAARKNNVGNWIVKGILKGKRPILHPLLFFKHKQDIVFHKFQFPRRVFEQKSITI